LYFFPLPHGHGSFLPIFVTKCIIVARPGDVLRMLFDDLRVRWEEALSQRWPCTACGSIRVWHDGKRLRKASMHDETHVEFIASIPARRLKCGDCRARWTRAPERVPSRAHYQACVVAHAIAMMQHAPESSTREIARAHCCHRRTLDRWIERVAALAEPAALAAEVAAAATAPVLPDVPTELAGGRTRTRAQLLRAFVVLALVEALASLRGLEPPALAHAAALIARIPASAPSPQSRADPRSSV